MNLVYFDDTSEYKTFIEKVVLQLQSQIGSVNYVFEFPDGDLDDFIFFNQVGKEIFTEDDLSVEVSPKMLLKKSTVEKYFGRKDCFFLIDINFASFDNPSNFDIAQYGLKLSRYLCRNGISKSQIILFSKYPELARIVDGSDEISEWCDVYNKEDFEGIDGIEILVDRIIWKIRKQLIASIENISEPEKELLVKEATAYGVIGESKNFLKLIEVIRKAAPTDARIFIGGENGVGKNLTAKMIHKMSGRSNNPFVEVNCAAIPSELIESELFGHEKGAFTGAVSQRIGKFEQANNGTIFLDEICDMSLSAQAKILRVLQERKITRVGGDKDIDVNVRVLSATNKNIFDEVDTKKFREDLFHRLYVVPIIVPSLNDRREDIPRLVDFLIKKKCVEDGCSEKVFSEDAKIELQSLNWSAGNNGGNIRELENFIARLLIFGDSNIVSIADVIKDSEYSKLKHGNNSKATSSIKTFDQLLADLKDITNLVSFWPSFKELIRMSKANKDAANLVWDFFFKVLYEASYNPLSFKTNKNGKTNQFLRVLIGFIGSLRIDDEKEGNKVIDLLLNMVPSIDYKQINFVDFDKNTGKNISYKSAVLNNERIIFMGIIYDRLGLSP